MFLNLFQLPVEDMYKDIPNLVMFSLRTYMILISEKQK